MINKKVLLAVSIVLACLLAAVLGGRWWVLNQRAAPAGEARLVEVPKGASLVQVADLLAQKELIAQPLAFRLAALLEGKSASLKAGEYELNPSMTNRAIVAILASGRVKLHSVTIPEGFTAGQVVERLAQERLVEADAALELLEDEEFIKALELDSESLEGYLFPDTYLLPRGMGARAVLGKMVGRFKQAWDPLSAQAKERGLTPAQAVTLASIIEKEARLDEERVLISAVYHNRLKKQMLLQADPTVIYGLGGLDRPLLHRDLDHDSPYNTYKYPGLPPGPICSPGLASLRAAVRPAQKRYLYFVARGDGSHEFSENYSGQIKAIRQYRR